MAELTLSIADFKKMAKQFRSSQVFESADAVVMGFGMHLLRAHKPRPGRMFRKSIPLLAVGYSGISSWKMTPLRQRKRVNGAR